MDYPGFCAKYGAGKMMALGYAFGPVAGFCVETMTHTTSLMQSAFMGYIGGVIGFGAAMAAHGAANEYCSEKKYGISRGGRIVKSAQAVSYGMILASALAVQQTGIMYDDAESAAPEDTKTSLQMRDKPQSIEERPAQSGLSLAV